MREKTEKCIVTFRTTTGAMAMAEAREAVEALVIKEHLDVDGLYAILI